MFLLKWFMIAVVIFAVVKVEVVVITVIWGVFDGLAVGIIAIPMTMLSFGVMAAGIEWISRVSNGGRKFSLW